MRSWDGQPTAAPPRDPLALTDKEKRKSKDVGGIWAEAKNDDGTSLVSDDHAAQVLKAVRDRAEGWRNGTATVLALITGTLVIGGDGTYSTILGADPAVPIWLGISAILGLVSLYFTLRSAHGPAFLDTKIRETREKASKRDLRRAGAAAADLKLAQWLLTIAVLVYLSVLVALWLA